MRSPVGTVFTEHRAAHDPKLYQPITNKLGRQRHAIEPIAHVGGLIAAGAILTLSRPEPARGSTYARPGRADGAAPGVDLRRRGRAEGQNALPHALRCRLTFQAQTQWLHGTAVGVIGYQNLVKDP